MLADSRSFQASKCLDFSVCNHKVAFVGGIDFAENRHDTCAPKFAVRNWMSSALKCGKHRSVVSQAGTRPA